jgi:hypothetical protein
MFLSLLSVAVEEVQVKVAIDTVKCMSQGSTMVPSSESVVLLAVERIDRIPNGDPGVVLDTTTGR